MKSILRSREFEAGFRYANFFSASEPPPGARVSVTRSNGLPATEALLASASSDLIGWSRVLLSHTLGAARSY